MTRLSRRHLAALALWLAAVLGVSLTAATPAAAAGVAVASPAGEIVVVTVNALQRDLDSARLDELAKALSTRADGAANDGTVYAPDVIVIQEITQSVLVSLRDKLNGLMNARYATAGHTSNAGFDGDMKVKLLLNRSTMGAATPKTWTDVCDATRIYQLITTTESATGKPVAVAGVHFAPMDNPAGSDDCKTRNSAELRKQLALYDEYGSVVGDFNRRAMTTEYECDPEELSGPMTWYSAITAAPAGGHAYLDAVREYHRRSIGLSMAQQWTFEKEAPEPICTGGSGIRRMRLDYIFVSDVLFPIEASVDDPGWAGATPGTIGCSVAPACKYSDHRFVAARLRLPGSQPPPVDTTPPAAPAGLTVSSDTAGQLNLDWADNGEVDLAGYRIERSADGVNWAPVTTSLLTASAYSDTPVTAGTTYSYRVVAVDTAGNVSPPSGVASGTATAIPPSVHIGDLDGTGTAVKSTWTAKVVVTVHDQAEKPVTGATVSYTWSAGSLRPGSCTTDATGSCQGVSSSLSRVKSVSLTVSGVTSGAVAYASLANHDPEADSNGTAITVLKP
ncbi:MAG: fibronectin type III domain-containing protein [Nocardioides sp.]